MEIIITSWALDSYTELKKNHCFTDEEFKTIIRPNVYLLKEFPNHPRFTAQQFWCPVPISSNNTLSGGFKMKWDSLGNSNNEIRLLVGIVDNNAYLCSAYLKKVNEQRFYLKFKAHLIERGRLK
jgi:hypothetical protein